MFELSQDAAAYLISEEITKYCSVAKVKMKHLKCKIFPALHLEDTIFGLSNYS